ncbi:MAG TPA: hypothetical protein VK464_22725, partial [Symbiobacteriaceae bacterium]|nr:hypothetical protein [Symbiobacteriaceae bacterium]
HGERLQRCDLATGQLTLLLPNRVPRAMSVAELPGGDLLVGQYAGGGHASYQRLPTGSTQLVKAAPFHMRLSPDKRWAVQANLWSQPELAVANVAIGEVVHYQPDTPWPPPGEKGGWPVSDPQWDEESRWLLYTVQGEGQVAPELRFFDRTKAERDRMIPGAQGVWLPGPGLQALVFRHSEGSVQPWRYDVAADRLLEPAGPKAAASGGEPGNCEPVGNMRVTAETAVYLTCDDGVHTFWMVDLTGRAEPLQLPLDRPAWVLSLDATGKRAALAILTDPGGMELRLVGLPGQ